MSFSLVCLVCLFKGSGLREWTKADTAISDFYSLHKLIEDQLKIVYNLTENVRLCFCIF